MANSITNVIFDFCGRPAGLEHPRMWKADSR